MFISAEAFTTIPSRLATNAIHSTNDMGISVSQDTRKHSGRAVDSIAFDKYPFIGARENLNHLI